MESNKNWLPILLAVIYTNRNVTGTTKQDSRISWLAQIGFAAFGKGVQLIIGLPYDETQQISRLTSSCSIRANESLTGRLRIELDFDPKVNLAK